MISMRSLIVFLTVSVPLFVSAGYSTTATYYGDYNSLYISTVACSDHAPGLYTGPSGSNWGYGANTLIKNVVQVHNGGNLYATAWNNVTGDGSSDCLVCLKVTASNGKYVQVTVIDRKGAAGVDLSDAAFDCLYGANAHSAGGSYTVTVDVVSNTPCSGGGSCSSGGGSSPPPPPTTKAPSPPSGSCKQYAVKAGDTGSAIASANGLNFNTQLSPWNPTVNWNALQVGQILCISQPGSSSTPPPPPPTGSCKKYSIKAGDTGYSIAQANGLNFNSQLSPWNPKVNWNGLQVGQQICISQPPAAETTAFQQQQSWAIPLIVVVAVVAVFILALAVVLGYKRKSRSRAYSSELGLQEVPTSGAAPTATETAVLTSTTQEPAKETVPATEDVSPVLSSSSLPAGWDKMTDPKTGQQYFYNNQTGVTQWETPDS